MDRVNKRPLSFARMARRTLLYATLLLISAVCLVPLYWMLRSSLMSNAEIFIFPPHFFPSRIRWDNYPKAFASFPVLTYLGNTMTIIIPCVSGVVVTSAMAGYALARIKWRGRDIWFALTIAAMILPGHVLLIPQYLTFSKLDLVNTFWSFIIPAWLGGYPSNIFLMRQFMMTLPKEYDEAAWLDGANRVQIFLRVLLPLLTPILITVAVFSFMNYWNDFQGPLIYLQRKSNYTLALGILSFKSSYSTNWNNIMAASLVMLVPALIMFGLGQKYFLQGITVTGIKG